MTLRTRTERNLAEGARQLLFFVSDLLPFYLQRVRRCFELGPKHLEHAVLLRVVKEVDECAVWPHPAPFLRIRNVARRQPAEGFDAEVSERLQGWLCAALSSLFEPLLQGIRESIRASEFEMIGTGGDWTELAGLPILVEVHKATKHGKLREVVVEVDLDVVLQPLGVFGLAWVRKGIAGFVGKPQTSFQRLTKSHTATL